MVRVLFIAKGHLDDAKDGEGTRDDEEEDADALDEGTHDGGLRGGNIVCRLHSVVVARWQWWLIVDV